MNIIEKTIFDTLVNYCKNHDWISFDGEFFEVNREKIPDMEMHKYENLSCTDAFICLRQYLKLKSTQENEVETFDLEF